jgi:hypothetical protein
MSIFVIMKKKYHSKEDYLIAKRLRDKIYRENNKEKIKKIQKDYHNSNSEYVSERGKTYRELNKTKISLSKKLNSEKYNKVRNNWHKKRTSTDKLYKLKCNLRVMLNNCFRKHNFKKSTKSELILGCSFDDFKNHIESNFEPWMNWDNHGLYNSTPNYGWDIDHIIPLASATCEEDIVKLNHFTNLRPLCSYINRVVKKAN